MAAPRRELWPIPDIPGELVEDPNIKSFLISRVAQLCGSRTTKFPGSQPVSFREASLAALDSEDYWVCEKSDGQRSLLYIVMNMVRNEQEVFLIDRKQEYSLVTGIHFPHWDDRNQPLTDTILDGELVYDIDPKTKERSLNYYAFDALVVHGTNIMDRPLLKRYGRLREFILAPFDRALRDIPEWRETLPFSVKEKKQELSYHLRAVIENHIPNLHHGNDGLIFTCSQSRYVSGTDEKILKFKPPEENTVDFKLELRFPPMPSDPSASDFEAVPAFLLNVWLGQDQHEFFDEMVVEDAEWEEWKESGVQVDDRIVEVYWDAEKSGWRFMRFRDDKTTGNHRSVLDKILISIEDATTIDVLLSRTDGMRAAWKAREAAQKNQANNNVQRPRGPAQNLPPTPGARGSIGPVTPGAPPAPYAMTPGLGAGLKR